MAFVNTAFYNIGYVYGFLWHIARGDLDISHACVDLACPILVLVSATSTFLFTLELVIQIPRSLIVLSLLEDVYFHWFLHFCPNVSLIWGFRAESRGGRSKSLGREAAALVFFMC